MGVGRRRKRFSKGKKYMANQKNQTLNPENKVGQADLGRQAATGGNTTRNASAANIGTEGRSTIESRPGDGRSGAIMPSGSSRGGTAAGTAAARSLYDTAKETAGQAYEVAAEKATTKLEEQKTNLSGGLASVADSVRHVSENLRGPDVQDSISKFTAEYSDVAARKIEDVANYLERKNVSEMYRDLEGFARRNPAVFVGGAFALGLIAARFLKSGTSTQPINYGSGWEAGRGGSGIAETPPNV